MQLKEKRWLNRHNLGTEQLLVSLPDAEADKVTVILKNSIRENGVSATDPRVTINRIGQENFPHMWASVPMIIKACALRNA